MTPEERPWITRAEERFARLPRMALYLLAAIFWPVTLVYLVYYLWSRELYDLKTRMLLTVLALLFLGSILFADFFPDREDVPSQPPAAEQPQ